MWTVFQPILFGLTGTLIDVAIMDGKTTKKGIELLRLIANFNAKAL